MRKKKTSQMSIFDESLAELLKIFPVEEKLKKMDVILNENPEIVDSVYNDLTRGVKNTGRRGIDAERILRCGILKQMKKYSYRELRSRLHDGVSFRWFTKFGTDKIPHYTALQKDIKAIKEDTWQRINDILIRYAEKKDLEKGKSLRTDTTVVESNISYPTDAKLLWDSIRVLTRIMETALEIVVGLDFDFHNRTRTAKKLSFSIVMARGKNAKKKRKKHYVRLIKTANEVFTMSSRCFKQLEKNDGFEAIAISNEMERYLNLFAVAIDQCERRVLYGEKVPASEKIVSIFEEHTDIIVRGKAEKPVEFGHKIMITTGKSGIISQFQTMRGNPDDGSTFKDVLDKHIEQYGKAPIDITADRKYFSAENQNMANEAGVKKVSIKKPGYRSKKQQEKEKQRWFKRLQRFRSGVEGIISGLMRGYGLKRCMWRGWEAFKSYVGLSVVTFNLQKIACLL